MSTKTYTAEEAHAAAGRGAAWLDKHCLNWVNEIDLGRLDLQSTSYCVLGQTAECLVGPEHAAARGMPGFWRVRNLRDRDGRRLIPDDEWCQDHGFDVPDATEVDEYELDGEREYGARYEMLTLAWSELIRERLAVQA